MISGRIMLVDKAHITELIPQRAPFVMIDALAYQREGKTGTLFAVKDDNLFLREGRLEAAALVENIAQTAAAAAGYESRQSGEKVKIGFIGAIKNLQVYALPVKGDLLETETSLVNSVFNVSIVTGEVYCKGKLLVSAEMKIFLQPHP